MNRRTKQIDSHLDRLMQLTAGDPQQQSSVVELRALEQIKMEEIAQTIALCREGKEDDARTLVLSHYGLLTMEHFRQVMDQLEQQEAAQEAARSAQYQKTVRRTIASIYLASFLAIIGLVLLAYYILREMALRERHAHEIREREEWFRVTLTSIGDAVIVTDQEGRVSFLNAVAQALTGFTMETVRGRNISEVFPIYEEVTGAPTRNPVQEVMAEGQLIRLSHHNLLRHRDGQLLPIEHSASPIRDDQRRLIGVVLVFRDVSTQRKSQELLRKSEKLSAAARLAATVAHEINNPLEAVGNLIYIAKSSPTASPDIISQLAVAEQELERVAHITRQTLGFYRETNEPEQIEIPALIDSVLRLYSNKLNAKNIRLERDFTGCPTITGIMGELKQVISNLVSNAIDAVPHEGTIRFQLKTYSDGDRASTQLIIEDDGPGIPPENFERIFEPFFTTKKDVGTGLGLWVSREIVERHGGTLDVRSVGNGRVRGASFIITLPCHPDPHSPTTSL